MIGGLLASTLVTLVLIPVAYTSVSSLVTRSRAGRWQTREPEPERATA